MATILEKANQILTEKNEKILPENIKAGIQVFDINGTFTADANAVAVDILSGKTAYVNGELISGTMIDHTNLDVMISVAPDGVVLEDANNVVKLNSDIYTDVYAIGRNHSLGLHISYSQLAEAIGLTADKIIVGNTILGIAGAAVKGDDLEAQLQAQDELIATQQAQIEELTAMLNDRASNITTETIDNVNDILGEEV